VNDAFQRGAPLFVVRRGIGANLPLPTGLGGPPRMDYELTRTTTEWTRNDEVSCPGGSIVRTMTRKELSGTRVAFEYREESRDCMRSTCTIDFELELAERACPPTTSPSCVPGRTRFAVAPAASLEVDCECASP
jgi:hypothetical protein